jgi:hypothetical protein
MEFVFGFFCTVVMGFGKGLTGWCGYLEVLFSSLIIIIIIRKDTETLYLI